MSNTVELPGCWDQELAVQSASIDWIWHGFIARSNLTLLTGLWKSGKTTLLSMLLANRKPIVLPPSSEQSQQAGSDATTPAASLSPILPLSLSLAHPSPLTPHPSLAALSVAPGKTIIVTEEPRSLWARRAQRYDFGGQVYFFSRPFRGTPTPDQWHAFIDQILRMHDEHGFDLLVIDPLAPLLKGENNARDMLDVLMPLATLTERGMAVLVLHHPARGNHPVGQAARGSGALLAHVDISIEMRHPGGDPNTRRRRFFALSRHEETPRQLTLELNADATDYQTVVETTKDGFDSAWPILCMIFEDAEQKLTRLEVFNEWPEDYEKPSRTALCNYLDHAVKNSLLACEGTGRKADPFRYWFPKTEEKWKQNPFHELLEMAKQTVKHSVQPYAQSKSSLAQDAFPPASPQDDAGESEE
jgi:hypothetical protein